MKSILYSAGKVIETREAVGTDWIIKDGDGVETGREPLTAEEFARFQAEGQPTPDEKLVTDLNAATTVAGLKAALLTRFGG
jgi:hypothetical protein